MQKFSGLFRRKKCSALLVTNRANTAYLSGFTGTSGVLFLTRTQGVLLTDARYHIRARAELKRGFRLLDITGGCAPVLQRLLKTHRVRTLGFEGGDMSVADFEQYKKTARGVRFQDVGEDIDALRMVKTTQELRRLARAQRIADTVFRRMKRYLKPGVTEREIAFLIEVMARDEGADDISFPPIVAFASNSAAPHHNPTNRKMKKGDVALIDMGVKYQGYCSDMTRTLFHKKPTDAQRDVYETVLKAQLHAMRAIRAHMTGKKADALARSIIEKAGYGKYFGHSLGHGIGLEVHERPNLSQNSETLLPHGTVVTIEPGIYLEGHFGVRIEDMVIVRKNGARALTKSPKALESGLY